MTHRDGFPRFSARSAWCSDAGHRKPCAPSESFGPSESLGKPPSRSRMRTGSGRPWGRRKALTMSRRTRGFPPARPLARRIACPISMGHYQRSLVLGAGGRALAALASGPRAPCRGGQARRAARRGAFPRRPRHLALQLLDPAPRLARAPPRPAGGQPYGQAADQQAQDQARQQRHRERHAQRERERPEIEGYRLTVRDRENHGHDDERKAEDPG